MVVKTRSPVWTELLVREWLLLLLRFAITRQPSDRSAVCAVVEQLDSLGRQGTPSAFHFFRRTNEELCRAVLMAGDKYSDSILRKHVARIDDPRLRRAFQAAIGPRPISEQRQQDKKRPGRK
jgi:hypothetical protein